MALLNEYAEIDEIVPGQFRHTQHLKKIAYRESGSLLAMVQDWENSGVPERPHKVDRAPIMVSTGEDGMRRIHPTREIDRYLEIGAPFIKTAGVWGKVNLGTPTRTGYRLQWTRPQANMYVDFGGHFIKMAILLKGGYVPEDSQIAFPVGINGLTRSGEIILRDGVPIMFLNRPVMLDLANEFDIRPIAHQFVNIGGQPYWHMTLPDLTGMIQPVIDPTLTLQPDGTAGLDAYINGLAAQSTWNFGVSVSLSVGEADSVTAHPTRSLIKFDLSSLPTAAIISSAILSIYETSENSSNTRTMRVFRTKRVWVEGTRNGAADSPATGLTWGRYDTTNNWSTAGGFHTDDCEQTDIGSRSFTATETLNEFKDFALTPTTKSGLDLGNGWLLKIDTETNDSHSFASSDNATAANRPKFVVIYSLPPVRFMHYQRMRQG